MYHKTVRMILILLALLAVDTFAQGYMPNFNQRDNEYRLLGLKRAKDAYEVALADYDRQKQLFDKGLITALELEQIRRQYSDAEVNYQQSLLAVLFEEQYVSVSKAVKYHSDDGLKHVRITLINASGGTAEFQKLLNIEDELFRSLQPDVIPNVYVSIMNEDGAIISRPYEAKLTELKYGEPQELDFTLLQDQDAVTIFIYYANGTQRSMKIFLEKDATLNKVAVQSEQFSQEVELGTSASFDLALELFSGVSNTFSLEVVNLPSQISRFFKDPQGQVRLSQVKFTQGNRTKQAALEISLPDRPSETVVMDVPIPFYVLVLPREQARGMADLHTRQWTEAELKEMNFGYVRLELLPRGKGELQVRSPQLYHAIKADETAEMYVDLLNEGSHRLDNIEVKIDLPLGWTKTVSPAMVPALGINEEARMALTFTPPDDIAVGKYQIRIRTSGLSNNEPVTAEDKTVTVEIKADTNVFGTILIVVLVVSLVGGIVGYGIRLSRR